ncbi:MAG: tetratricopeptide repeat protein [Planctomycetota bacterium]|nr:tetratricopeptide repeat protein [Planctomycetota bacterium]
MADDQKRAPEEAGVPSDGTDAVVEGAEAVDLSSRGNLWQVPAIIISLALIAVGLFVGARHDAEMDFDGALDRVDQLIVAREFETARAQLEDFIGPRLEEASPLQQARFQRATADWIAAVQETRGAKSEEGNRLIAEKYAEAASMGAALDPPRLERWANALIDLGELEEARHRVTELEALSVSGESGRTARACRNRLLRRLVDASLAREEMSEEAKMAALAEYREDSLVSAADEAWAMARQAELRLESGDAADAVAHLLVDMRRLERTEERVDPAAWGELYTLLARGYFARGRYDDTEFHLQRALEQFEGPEPARADALLLFGRLAVARNQPERALEYFDAVIGEYSASRAHLPALLARAEVQSIIGRHEASLEDFRQMLERLPEAAGRADVTPRLVAARLADRHDAALTIGRLPLALEYVSLGESLFAAGDVPVEVLYRIASTSRQIADDMIARARKTPEGDRRLRLDEIDPAVRYQAQTKYEQAGDYFLRHARALTTVPEADAEWAESLRLAADSYDLAGRRQKAIRHFLEYIAGCSVDDPRRAEVTYRLAAAYEAEMDYQSAAEYYEQVIAEHPRSVYGTRSHVPLARCYVALERRPEAVQQLTSIVDNRRGGMSPITPESLDYRDALFELGVISHEAGQYREAIERLATAVQRYRDDARINEMKFRLADSYRRLAGSLREEAKDTPTASPGERRALEQRAEAHFESALSLFGEVSRGYADMDEARLNRLQRDFARYASLNRGDCAFALGRYAEAAEYYDQAARKHSGHHCSMYALIQIVNCYDRLGDRERADVAHHRALEHLSRLPDEAFADPQALLDRAAWEQWLRNRPLGLVRGPTDTGPN